MRKIFIYIILLFTINVVKGQSCLPEGIVFFLQEQIDNFQTNYPNCTQIEGDVEIWGSSITNLNGLSVVTSIGGYFSIFNTDSLSNLTGMEGLTSIGESLQVGYWNTLGQSGLIDLTGLENLTSVAGNVLIMNCKLLTSLTGLEGLTSIGGILQISDNPALTSFTALINVTSIGGDFITFETSISDFTGLNHLTFIGRDLDIESSHLLSSLNGLESLYSIGRDLKIINNNTLVGVSGVNNLTHIGGGIDIWMNNALTNLEGLINVTSIGGTLFIWFNPVLNSLVGLDNIDPGSVESLIISRNPTLSTCEVQSICDLLANPGSNIQIHDNATGCNNPAEVEAACAAISVENLTNDKVFAIFPNPSAGFIYFKFDSDQSGPWEVRLTNALGTRIKSIRVSDPDEAVDISDLPTGIYFCLISSKSLNFNGKFVKL